MNYPIGPIPQNLTTGQKQPSSPDIRPIVDASCQLRVKFSNGDYIPICSGTLIESNRVETSNHGVDEAIKIAKQKGGELVFRFNKVDVGIAKFDSHDQKDDVEIIKLQIHVPISPAPAKGNPPKSNVPLIFVHYPNGKLAIDNGTLLTSTQKELILMGKYPSDKGSCGGSLYYQKGNNWVRLGHHRYSSTINQNVKAFGTEPKDELIMGGDILADRAFQMMDIYNYQPRLSPRPISSRLNPQEYSNGPDIPEAVQSGKTYQSFTEATYKHHWSYSSFEVQETKNDLSGTPIRGIDITVRSKVTPHSKKKTPGSDGIPNNTSDNALFILSPNPHEISAYAKNTGTACQDFYDSIGEGISAHFQTTSRWPKYGSKIRVQGKDFYIYRQIPGTTKIVDELSSGQWYGDRYAWLQTKSNKV
jgi:hypothetical protein